MTKHAPGRDGSTPPAPRSQPAADRDSRPGLRRGVGPFASFAAGFSFVSILTTVFQLFGTGFGFGGAAFFWTWPAVFAGQLLVAAATAAIAMQAVLPAPSRIIQRRAIELEPVETSAQPGEAA